MGSKARIAKYILPIMKEYLNGSNYFVDAFCGGCNLIDKLDYPNKIANDQNQYLIALFSGLLDGEVDKMPYIGKETYMQCRADNSLFTDFQIGYIGFVCSVNGKFFNGFSGKCETKGGFRDYQSEAKRSLLKSKEALADVVFTSVNYASIVLPSGSVIYCDPPYQNTTSYKGVSFNHEEFWQWCRDMSAKGHKVFVSEYQAPEDFTCIWEKPVTNSLNTTKTYKPIEKLFTI